MKSVTRSCEDDGADARVEGVDKEQLFEEEKRRDCFRVVKVWSMDQESQSCAMMILQMRRLCSRRSISAPPVLRFKWRNQKSAHLSKSTGHSSSLLFHGHESSLQQHPDTVIVIHNIRMIYTVSV